MQLFLVSAGGGRAMLVLGTVASRTEISSVRVVLLGGGLENHRVRTKCRDHCHFLEPDFWGVSEVSLDLVTMSAPWPDLVSLSFVFG